VIAGAFGGPNTYIQRGGEIRKLAAHVAPIEKRAVVVMDRAVEASLSGDLRDDFDKQGIEARFATFGGECTTGEIDRIGRLTRDCGSQVPIGEGGGKTANTVKSAAVAVDARIVVVSTIASSDAPCSAITVRYSPNGVFEESVSLPRHPDLALVDTDIVVQAPARFLVADIGDALSTWFEARSSMESRSKNYVAGGFPPTRTGIAVARECHEALMRDAVLATIAVENKLCTTAFDNIVGANILLSWAWFRKCWVFSRSRQPRWSYRARRGARLPPRREGGVRNALPAYAREPADRRDRSHDPLLPFGRAPDNTGGSQYPRRLAERDRASRRRGARARRKHLRDAGGSHGPARDGRDNRTRCFCATDRGLALSARRYV